MREFSWHFSDKDPVYETYEELEKILIMQDATSEEAQQPYANILSQEGNCNQAFQLAQDMHGFFIEGETTRFAHQSRLHRPNLHRPVRMTG